MEYQLRAVVFDDVSACRELLVEVLENRGYRVVSHSDLSAHPLYTNPEATCSSSACPDILLTDNRMPYMTGLEFLNRQRQCNCPLSPSAKAIFSGSWTTEELQQSQQLGCQIFHKPYEFDLIEAWLDEQEALILARRAATGRTPITGKKHPEEEPVE
ncbi:response regulator [Geopsychrobacter electrodiphilus]|uniref:response regulator n=1 Tax=Geopsychrobacter electrodiphilus TaxID=225196 RepID=UPI000371DC24|nr:response regulator [Geopsychrobacter electrodiphilus]